MKTRKNNSSDFPISPNLYYFNRLEDVDLNQIEGNAIVFVEIGRLTRFVKDNRFVEKEVEYFDRSLNNDSWHWMKEKRQENGQIKLEDKPAFWEWHRLITIEELTRGNHFPYVHTTLSLSITGRSINLESVFQNGWHIIPSTLEHNIHPILKEALQKADDPSYNLLTLLYKLKASPDVAQSIDGLYQEVRPYPISRLQKGRRDRLTLDEMIDIVHKAMGTKFMSFAAFKKEKNKIIERFDQSKLTPQKAAIYDDFENFYKNNKNDPDQMPRSVLIENWVKDYEAHHDNENPFTILNKQRRTGPLSIFNPGTTASIKLFNKFLAGEIIPPTLRQIMQGDSVNTYHSKSISKPQKQK